MMLLMKTVMLMMISYNLDGEEDVDERLLADDETGDVADDVGNEEDGSLLFFLNNGTTPPCRTGRACAEQVLFVFHKGAGIKYWSISTLRSPSIPFFPPLSNHPWKDNPYPSNSNRPIQSIQYSPSICPSIPVHPSVGGQTLS